MQATGGGPSFFICAPIVVCIALHGCTRGGAESERPQDPWDEAMLTGREALYRDPNTVRIATAKAIAIADAQGDHERAQAARFLLAEALIHHHDTGIHALLEEIRSLSARMGMSDHRHRATYYSGLHAIREGNWDKGYAILAPLTNSPQGPGRRELVLQAQIAMAQAAAGMRNLRTADSIIDPVLAELGHFGDLTLRCRSLIAKGTAHLETGHPEQARILFDKARLLAVDAEDRSLEAKCHQSIGYTYAEQGDYAPAVEHFKDADELFRALGDARSRIMVLNTLGYCYWGVLPTADVMDQWNQAKQLADSLRTEKELALVHLNIARFMVGLDSAECMKAGVHPAQRWDSIASLVHAAQKTGEDLDDDELLALSMKVMAGSLNHQGRFDASTALLRESAETFRRKGNLQSELASHTAVASNLISLGLWRDAIAALEHSLPMAERSGYHSSRMHILHRLSHAYKMLGEHRKALEYMEMRNAVKDTVERLEVTDRIAQEELRYRFSLQQISDSITYADRLRATRLQSLEEIRRQRQRAMNFAGGGAALLAGAGLLFVVDRKRRHERHAKESARLETQALRSQMNPHFIFNALNSINAFIREQDPAKAQHFVARFARLMRLVLENSRHTEVPLSEDLEALSIYMELEQARSMGRFDYSIDVDPTIDKEEVRVPPLVLQPFVENAIWHGLEGKEDKGHIRLAVRREGERMLFTISDDGKGMNGSGVQHGGTGKQSLGGTITKARLDLVQRQKRKPAGFRYVEAPVGTTVEVTIPI